jgi:hypothetical protein
VFSSETQLSPVRCWPPIQPFNMRGDDLAATNAYPVIAKAGELDGYDVVATGQNRANFTFHPVKIELPSPLIKVPRIVDEGDHPGIRCGFNTPVPNAPAEIVVPDRSSMMDFV